MLNDTTSSAVTSSRDSTCDDDVIRTNDVTENAVSAVGRENSVNQMIIGEYDEDMAAEYVDVSSTSSLTSRAADTDAVSVDTSRAGQRSECRVCGDHAAGMYFGALVCVPCKVRAAQYSYTPCSEK